MLPGKKFSLADILRIARRRAWLIGLPPAVLFFGALCYSSTVPNVYQSDMLIAIDPQRVPDSFVRSTVTMATDQRVEAITVQVLSRSALQKLIETHDLYPDERKAMPMEDVVAKMRSDVQIRLERPRPQWGRELQPTAFHVLFTYHDAAIAAKIAQLIGAGYVDQNVRDRGALAGATSRFLQNQLEEARAKLVTQEQRLEAFRQRHGPELPTQQQANMQTLMNKQLEAQSLAESIARDRDSKQMLERLYREAVNEPPTVAAVPAGGGAPVDTTPATASARQQLTAAKAQLASLLRRYKTEHPDVVRTQTLITELEPKAAAEAAEEASRTVTAEETASLTANIADPGRRENLRQMNAEVESLNRQIAFKETEERRVRADITEYQRRLEAVPGLESEFTSLTRDYDTQQTQYRELLSKSSAAQVALNLEEQDIAERFRVVDPAGVPVRPVPATRGRINAAGLAIGLLIGLGLAALLEIRDASFRSDTEVLEVLGLPVLALVPRIETGTEKVRKHRRKLALSVAGASCLVLAGYVTWSLKLWNSLL